MIKYELQYFDNLLNSKHQLNAELKNVQGLLSKVTNSITELQNSSLTEEEATQLAEFESQKIELLTRLNEIAQSFNSINQEIGSYNVEKIEEAKELISVVVEFSRVTEEIKTAEKLSKKSNGSKVILENAEGRKKEIAEELAESYKDLITKKKNLMIQHKKAYEKLNGMPSLKQQREVLQQIENPEPVVSQSESLEEIDYFENFSLEEKMIETKKRIDRIIKTGELPNQGKKVLITYNGQKYKIPKVYYGRFSETLGLLRKLEKEQLEKNNSQITGEMSSSQNNVEPPKVEPKKEEKEATITKKRKGINIKNMLKKHWKSVAAIALAVTISATALVASLSKKLDKRINTDISPQTISATIIEDNAKEILDLNEEKAKESLDLIEESQSLASDSINIGTTVSISETAPIYNNMHDATNGTNQLNQMYPGNNMSVLGVVFNVNDNLVFVTDTNQINGFRNMGCEETAYAVSLDGSNITGFYNVNDVVNTIGEGTKTL